MLIRHSIGKRQKIKSNLYTGDKTEVMQLIFSAGAKIAWNREKLALTIHDLITKNNKTDANNSCRAKSSPSITSIVEDD